MNRYCAYVSTCLFFMSIATVSDVTAESPKDLIALSGVKGGLVVHVGCGNGETTALLRVDDKYLVHGLDPDAGNVARARTHIQSLGIYGPVSVRQWTGDTLPYADNLVNLIICEGSQVPSMTEIMRVLTPLGVAYVEKDGAWEKTVKGWPEDIDEWSHYLHEPDNNAVARDTVVETPRSMQWVSGPKWGRSHEEMASMSAAVSTKGRLFFIVDEAPLASIRFSPRWKLVARDAFNGVLLWKRDISVWTDHLRHFRSGPAHLPRRLVASDDRVFVTLGLDAPVQALDAATGETLHTYTGTEHTEEILFRDGTLYVVTGTSEVNVFGGGLSRRGEPDPTQTRYIAAIDADSGEEIWRKTASQDGFILPSTLAVKDGRVFFQTTYGLVSLDAGSGRRLWSTPRRTVSQRYGWSVPTLVVYDDVVLLADRDPSAKGKQTNGADGGMRWGVHGWTIDTISRKGPAQVIAYSAEDGTELWSCKAAEGYNSPVDVLVADDLVWLGPDFSHGRDVKTGDICRTVPVEADPVGMTHHRCYRNKASSRFIFTGNSGVEIIDLEKGWDGNNSWVRGTCQYGIIPCNGMIYAPPNACACFGKVKQPGFNVLAGNRTVPNTADIERLNKGKAYGSPVISSRAGLTDWPMYRRDAARSGATSAKVSARIKERWSVDVGGRLTQPILADGRIFVAETDTHTVHAFRRDTGKRLWKFTAGGRIDSSPSVYRGLVLFGSADGRVYCVRASDGVLVWSFLAAPEDRLVGAYGQLESAWPVHGAVLLQNDEVIFSAGRSSYLDGGIHVYRLNPVTGAELSHTVVYHLDPETGKQIAQEGRHVGLKFDMEGTRTDVLTGNGTSFYLKHLPFDSSGSQIPDTKPHLFSITGFLGEEWYVRSFWMYGTEAGAGYGGWAGAANHVPAGRILSFDDETAYGYGRVKYIGGKAGHTANTYHFYSLPMNGTDPNSSQSAAAQNNAARKRRRARNPGKSYNWTQPSSLIVRALALASDKLLVAGLPDIAIKEKDVMAFENEPDALDAFTGKQGALLRIVSAADGAQLAEYELDASPVMDGLSVVDGAILMSMRNGKLTCWENE